MGAHIFIHLNGALLQPLPPLKTVFDCPNIELCIANGKWKEWMEMYLVWSILHTCTCNQGSCTLVEEKVMWFSSVQGYHPPTIPGPIWGALSCIYEIQICHHEFVLDYAKNDQMSAVGTLLHCWWGRTIDVPHDVPIPGSGGAGSSFSSSISSNGHPVTSSSTNRSFQPLISTAFHNQQDICKSHNTTLEFAIADFFYWEHSR